MKQTWIGINELINRGKKKMKSINALKGPKAYSGTLTRREIVRANASLGELRRVKEKLSLPISCELRRVRGK